MEPPPRRTSAPIRPLRRGVSLPETDPALRTALEPRQLEGAEPEAVAGITHSGHSSLARNRVLRGGGVL